MASAIINATRQGGLTIGIALLGALTGMRGGRGPFGQAGKQDG
jgi:hypothetical protein